MRRKGCVSTESEWIELLLRGQRWAEGMGGVLLQAPLSSSLEWQCPQEWQLVVTLQKEHLSTDSCCSVIRRI